MIPIILILFIILCLVIFTISVIRESSLRKQIFNLNQDKVLLELNISKSRQEAVKQSKAVIKGKVTEEILPLFQEFPYELQDCKMFGNPIDYLVYDGMTRLRDTGEGEITIVFADVKVNTSSNSKVQTAIKKAIKEGRVRFENWNVIDNKLKIK